MADEKFGQEKIYSQQEVQKYKNKSLAFGIVAGVALSGMALMIFIVTHPKAKIDWKYWS